MVIDWTVYFEDGTSSMISCEKSAGAHPDSIAAVVAAIREAESTGNTVSRIGRSTIIGGVPIDLDTTTREQVVARAKLTAPHLVSELTPSQYSDVLPQPLASF